MGAWIIELFMGMLVFTLFSSGIKLSYLIRQEDKRTLAFKNDIVAKMKHQKETLSRG